MQIKTRRQKYSLSEMQTQNQRSDRGLSENVLGSYEKQVQVLVAVFEGLDACAEKVV